MERKSTLFRRQLARPGAILSAGVYDALSARMAELAGFDAVHHSGYGTAAALLGAPDIGLVDFSEMCRQVKNIARSVSIPVLGDADTGYGNALNVYRTVQEYVWTGASGTFIEDQQWPKRCGHMEGKRVVSREEMRSKLRAAVDARDEEDPDFVIIFRTDALAVEGLDSALDRARDALDVGADVIFVEALRTREEMERVVDEIGAPLMLNLIEGGKTPLLSLNEAQTMGFKYVVFALSALYGAVRGMKEALEALVATGRTGTVPSPSFDDFAPIVRSDLYAERARRYGFEPPGC